jgi:RNA polymerase sigma-70 factor (ECF subfamily)
MHNDPADSADLLARARGGNLAAQEALFNQHRDRLRKMVDIRLDRRLQGRVDPSSLLQEAFQDVVRQLDEYPRDPRLPLFLWLRQVVGERLLAVHRQHLGSQVHDLSREVSLYHGALPQASSAALAAQLLGKHTSPSVAVLRAERIHALQEALNSLDETDREIVSLRHFEELSLSETALVLGIPEPATARRYIRALKRLREALADLPGSRFEGF